LKAYETGAMSLDNEAMSKNIALMFEEIGGTA
jgi:hypothetical protein